MFSCEYWKISKNTFFEEHLYIAASVCPICFCPLLEEFQAPFLANVPFQRYRFLKLFSDIDCWY